MKKTKSQKEREGEAELRRAENWWAGLSDGEKRVVHLVETLHTQRVGFMKRSFGSRAGERIEGAD
jgi:hypothetical protein